MANWKIIQRAVKAVRRHRSIVTSCLVKATDDEKKSLYIYAAKLDTLIKELEKLQAILKPSPQFNRYAKGEAVAMRNWNPPSTPVKG